MNVMSTIVFAVLGSYGASAIAVSKKCDDRTWWVAGLCLSIFAVILVSILPAKPAQERC